MMTLSNRVFLRLRRSVLHPSALLLIFGLGHVHLSSAQAPQPQTSPKKDGAAPPASGRTPNTANVTAQTPKSLKEAVQKKKVLTEDDLHPQSRRTFGSAPAEHEFNPICVPECEQRVRDAVQVDDVSELEFRNKFALATQQIDDDRKWGNALVEAIHAADEYCDLERNRGRYAYPGSTPPYTTDKLSFDFISKEREVVNRYVMAKGNVDIPIRAMQYTDAFRATVMQSVWDVALERSCRGVDHI